jgi:peroxiredoxin
MGIEIVGVGFGSPEDNLSWAQDEGFQYEIWSDDDRTLAVYYGAAGSSSDWFPARRTVLLGSQGELLLEYEVSDFGTHPAKVLEDCQAIFAE